ncbi:2Fe-2S iron-sulfur cluster-binding protein [Pseudanabaena sp. PCC 6802]|uniref:2Fe-2S iron-sulfur cluster-binding protein n=1 Tax=Pseudanabaena sp. PCC 6802 TaxID=118173 RepID=UPI0003498FAA|nr:2Fe-2S iron-sulfur cluster-binding protein [Pseudanabaena sp. PCC 6802]
MTIANNPNYGAGKYVNRGGPARYTVTIRNRQTGAIHQIQVSSDRYILEAAEEQGIELPFACRNGACTTCAMRVKSGRIYQPEAIGLSADLKQQNYALVCVGYACSDVEIETQDEDEVYQLQFGRYFAKKHRHRVVFGLPIDHD